MKIKYSSLKNEARRYWRWSRGKVDRKVPIEVAKQGAGSESRTPLMHYGAVLPVYLAVLRYLESLRKKEIKLLELGCGTGKILAFLKNEMPRLEIWGTDFSRECIEYANKNYKKEGLYFLVSDAKKTPFSRGSFDVVISSHVIEHLTKADGEKFLKEAKTLVRDGGVVLVGTPERKWCQGVYSENIDEKEEGRLIPPHLHEYKKDELLNLAKKVFGKGKARVDLLKNSKFKNIFVAGVEKIKPGKLANGWFRWMRDKMSRNVFDEVTKVGNWWNLLRYKMSYKDILFDNRIVEDKEGLDGENLLLVCQK